jgi:hypothetical protein
MLLVSLSKTQRDLVANYSPKSLQKTRRDLTYQLFKRLMKGAVRSIKRTRSL